MIDEFQRQSLMPWPARLSPLEAAPLPADVALEPVFAGIRTARLERAVERFLASRPQRAGGGERRPLTLRCREAAAPFPALGDDESYVLEVSAAGVQVAAPAEWGVLRALATLTQLWPEGGGLPAQRIDDAPRFAWRGLMIDVARHFIPADDLLRTLEAMAVFKVNVLHLHLTDDQGFRFPSHRYPELCAGPHYSRDELRRLVARGAELGIRLVPELDVPGHTASWLAAYPAWGSGEARPTRRFGVHRECLDPSRSEVMEALAALFEELAEVFPDAYVHIGGDEVHPDWWSSDARIQEYMRRNGLADVRELQAHFNARLAALLAGRGKRSLGWDEVLHPDLPGSVTVQSWRGATARDRALAAGHDCVVSAPYYLDLFFPADVHYAFDPAAPQAELVEREDALLVDPRLEHVADGMAWTRQWREEPAGRSGGEPGTLLGAEACLWSELVDARVLDVRLWSRMPALAERFWSPAGPGDVDDMYRRLEAVLARLPGWAGVDVAAQSRALLLEAGVQQPWLPLVEVLEPVKWYGRLLGEDALAARLQGREMPQARPYDADTPLNRAVDALPPESLPTRRMAGLCRAEARGDAGARAQLEALARSWRELPRSGAGPAELEALARELAALSGLVLGVLDGSLAVDEARRRLAAAAAPVGEYLLAPVPVLRRWLDMRGTQS